MEKLFSIRQEKNQQQRFELYHSAGQDFGDVGWLTYDHIT